LTFIKQLYLEPANTSKYVKLLNNGFPHFGLVYYLYISIKERSYVFSSPRMRWADIEVPNSAVDMDSRALLACYPRGSFYPMIFPAPISALTTNQQ